VLVKAADGNSNVAAKIDMQTSRRDVRTKTYHGERGIVQTTSQT